MNLKKLPLWKNMSWTVIGSLLYALTQWFILIILAKLTTPEITGIYMYGLAVTAPIIIFAEMDLRTILVTDAKSKIDFNYYLSTRIIFMILALFIICIVAVLLRFDFITLLIVIFIGAAKVSESISDIFHGQLQKLERMDYIAFSQIFKGTLTLLAFFILLYFTGSLIYAVISQLVIWIAILLIFDLSILKKYVLVKPLFRISINRSLIKIAIPLGIVSLLVPLQNNLPYYFVEYYFGKEELGFFGALVYILFAGNRLVNSLRQPIAPILSDMYERKSLKEFHNLTVKMILIGVLIGITGVVIAYFAGDLVLSTIYSPEYTSYLNEFVLIMLSGVFIYPLLFIDTAVDSARYFIIQPFLGLFWVISSIVIGFWLIPQYGLTGAAYLILITAFIRFLSYIVVYIYILKKAKKLEKEALLSKISTEPVV